MTGFSIDTVVTGIATNNDAHVSAAPNLLDSAFGHFSWEADDAGRQNAKAMTITIGIAAT
jgi:hypothetical protein